VGLAIRYDVPSNTAAKAAVGTCEITGLSTRTTTSKNIAWVMATMRLFAWERTFTLVRAIAPVAGIPPMREEAIVATP
jgi:hypothetical protein